MFRHSVFGVRLECDFALPDLSAATSDGPIWRVETRRAIPPAPRSGPIGSETVQADISVRAYASRGAFRLTFDDTGTFDVLADERRIAWYPGPAATDAAVRADLLGRVMALAAHADGRFALHASAVSIDGRAVAFLGPKHAGKSTLAFALVQRGARLVADDALVVRLDAETPWATLGVQRPRLWTDSLRALGVEADSPATEKPTVGPLPPDRLERAEVPLVACYLLNPVWAEDAPIARSARLSSVQSALAFVRFSKLGALMGGAEAPVVLDRAAKLAGCTPMYAIDVARDLGRLDAAATALLGWHMPALLPNVAPPPG